MVSLHRETLGDPSKPCLLLTHGIYGSGANWRKIARKVVEQRRDWSIALVDLRNHGRSGSGSPPHDLAACARDIAELAAELPTAALAGHSFGGKVMLAARAIVPGIAQTWMFDASPSPRPGAETDPDNSVSRVLALMERLPRQWAKRDEFVNAVIADGHAPALANWLGMNVVPVEGGQGVVLRLDLSAIREMLQDYYAQDLWSVAFDGSLSGTLEIVIADRSTTISDEDRARLAAAPAHVNVHHVDAGHWLHIEAGDNVVQLLVSSLPTSLR